MNELAAALRQFADRIERGEPMPGATQCALVLANDSGMVRAIYIGKMVPANRAGIDLLAAGVQRFNADSLQSATPLHSTTRGSTH